jgi:hypothetical protein
MTKYRSDEYLKGVKELIGALDGYDINRASQENTNGLFADLNKNYKDRLISYLNDSSISDEEKERIEQVLDELNIRIERLRPHVTTGGRKKRKSRRRTKERRNKRRHTKRRR